VVPIGRVAAVLGTAMLVSVAHAYPEGAPWGAARPDAVESCATCHFDGDAVADSTAITVSGFPEEPQAGATYSLTVGFEVPEAATAGFQVLAISDGGGSGSFAAGAADMETGTGAIRSTHPSIADGGATWTFDWTAPPQAGAVIHFYIAVMASNDDGSPFGDQVHFLSLSIRL
jgi:hypothetical protein